MTAFVKRVVEELDLLPPLRQKKYFLKSYWKELLCQMVHY